MKRKRMLYFTLGVVAVLVLIPLTILVVTVDDWSRDLTTNYAETSETAATEGLRPLHAKLPVADLAAIVRQAASERHWSLVEDRIEDDVAKLHFERKTRLLGFIDDVRAEIHPTAEGSRLDVRSQSRVGKGDLGQNPRNIVELVFAVRTIVGE